MSRVAKSKKKRTERSPRVTWANIVTPKDSGKTAEELRAESSAAGPQGTQGPQLRSVPRSSLHLAESVFQWRGGARADKREREEHIRTLATALKNQGTPLERLTVWPVADRLYVLDGHHRLAAYDTVKWMKPIPVEVFEGDLDEARLRALAGNIKDKLRMTSRQKSEVAWRITKENIGKLSAEGVADATTISRRQAFVMKRVWRELNGRTDLTETQREKLPTITWQQARDPATWGTAEAWDADEWIDQKATELAELLRTKNVEAALTKDVEITATALYLIDGRLPERLIEQWAGDHRELIIDLAKTFTGPDEDF